MILQTRYQFGQFLNSLGLVGRGVEVGTFQGSFALDILHVWKGDKLYLVDAWRELEFWRDTPEMKATNHLENMLITAQRTETFRERVCMIRERSVDAVNLFPDGSLDFVYIDADHSYESVKADLEAWLPKVTSQGIIAGHDYDNREGAGFKYGVKRAVDEAFGGRVQCTKEPDPTWWVRL